MGAAPSHRRIGAGDGGLATSNGAVPGGNDREYVRSSGHGDAVRHDSTQTDEEII